MTIDQRLKEFQHGAPAHDAILGARSHSQTPHPFVDSTRFGSSRASAASPKYLRLFGTAFGVVLVFAAGLLGAYIVRQARQGAAVALQRPSGAPALPAAAASAPTTSTSEPAANLSGHASPTAPTGNEEDRESGEHPTSLGASTRASKPRLDPRRLGRPPSLNRALGAAVGAADPSPQSAPEAVTKAAAAEQSDFVHERGTKAAARPIETASPYSN